MTIVEYILIDSALKTDINGNQYTINSSFYKSNACQSDMQKCISQEECRIIIDVGVESNNSWFLFIPTFPITNNKKGEGEAKK